MEGSENGQTANELPRICQLLPWIHQRICRQGVSNAEADAQQRKEVRMERWSTGCVREHKAVTVRSASARHTYRKRHVCSWHRRVGSSHLRNIASGARMEWKNGSPSHCIWQQGFEWHWDEIWCTKSRWVCSSHFRGKVPCILGERYLQVTREQQSFILVEDLLDGSELYW